VTNDLVRLLCAFKIKYSITSLQSEPENATMPIADRSSFENLYAGQPRWEIGKSQKEIEDAFAEGWVVESIEPSRSEVRSE